MSDLGDYADDVTKSRRLAMLRVVRENEGAANRSLVRASLNQLGFRGRLATDEALDGDIDLLTRSGLIKVEWYRGSVQTLVILPRGSSFLRREVDPLPGIDYPDF